MYRSFMPIMCRVLRGWLPSATGAIVVEAFRWYSSWVMIFAASSDYSYSACGLHCEQCSFLNKGNSLSRMSFSCYFFNMWHNSLIKNTVSTVYVKKQEVFTCRCSMRCCCSANFSLAIICILLVCARLSFLGMNFRLFLLRFLPLAEHLGKIVSADCRAFQLEVVTCRTIWSLHSDWFIKRHLCAKRACIYANHLIWEFVNNSIKAFCMAGRWGLSPMKHPSSHAVQLLSRWLLIFSLKFSKNSNPIV